MTGKEKIQANKNWRLRWLELIFEFAHIDFQRGLWIEHIYPNAIGWFGEDVCKYFDDLSLDDNYQYQLKEGLITQEEFVAIENFHSALVEYLQTDTDEKMLKLESEILMDSDWIRVVMVGASAWQNLKTVINDSEETAYMNELEKYFLHKS